MLASLHQQKSLAIFTPLGGGLAADIDSDLNGNAYARVAGASNPCDAFLALQSSPLHAFAKRLAEGLRDDPTLSERDVEHYLGESLAASDFGANNTPKTSPRIGREHKLG